jgi:hypothetical protein
MDGTCRITARDKKCLKKNSLGRRPVCVILWHCQDLDCITSSGRVIDEFESNKLFLDRDSILAIAWSN